MSLGVDGTFNFPPFKLILALFAHVIIEKQALKDKSKVGGDF